MEETISLKFTGLIGILMLTVVLLRIVFSSNFSTSFIVFCDVGQGDGAYIRIRDIDILIDGGPDKKILTCLSRYMPFYDRTIEYVFLSHPQKDHYGGFSYVLNRYTIKTFVVSYTESKSDSFKALLKKLGQRETNVTYWSAKTKLYFKKGCQMILYWPTDNFVKIVPSRDPNEYSQVLLLDCNTKRVLFTGDLDGDSVKKYLRTVGHVDLLKVPHHGSKNGLKKYMLISLSPREAVISVGKRNSYGHPHKNTLELLNDFGVQIRRTDMEGDIVYHLD